jgi:hypothetical protein
MRRHPAPVRLGRLPAATPPATPAPPRSSSSALPRPTSAPPPRFARGVNRRTYHRIDHSADGGSACSQIATPPDNATGYRDDNLSAGHAYHDRLFATNGAGASTPQLANATIPAGAGNSDGHCRLGNRSDPDADRLGWGNGLHRSAIERGRVTLRGQPTGTTVTDTTTGGPTCNDRAATGPGVASGDRKGDIQNVPFCPFTPHTDLQPGV